MTLRSLSTRSMLCLTAAVIPAAPALAANYYWDGNPTVGTADGVSEGGDGVWNTVDPVWDTGAAYAPWANGNTAVFAGTPGTVTLGTPISALNVQLNGTGYTVAANGTNTLTLTAFTASTTPSPLANSALYSGGGVNTVAGPVVLAGSTAANTATYLTAAAGATLNLTGTVTATNTATSGTTVYGPGVVNYSGTAFATGKFNVAGGVTFNSSGPMSGFTQTYTGINDTANGTTWNVNAGSAITAATTLFLGSGTATSGTLTVNGGTASFLAVNAGNNFNNGTDTASVGTVTVNGGTLSNTGATRLGGGLGTGTLSLNGGTYNIGGTIARGVIGTTGGVANTGGSATLNFNGGTLRPTANNLTVGGLTVANVRNGGAVVATNGQVLTISQALVHSTIAGDNAVDGGLNKGGGGTLILTGTNTYTGPTLVTGGGILQIGNGGTIGSIPATNITVQDSGSVLNVNRSDEVTLGQTITGLGSVSKSGAGTLILGGTNAFAAGLNIGGAGGNVRLTSSTAAGTGTISINGQNAVTGTLELTGGITVANALTAVVSRNDPTATGTGTAAAGVAQVRNVSGSNTLTGNGFGINAGGLGNLIESQAGTLTFTGNFAGNNSGSTFARPYFVFGAGDVAVTGNVANGTAAGGAGVTKQGTGTLTLSGTNAYAGATVVQAGVVRATTAAYAGTVLGAGTAGLDVQGGRFVFVYGDSASPVSQIKAILDAGYQQPTKFATGPIRSTTLAAGRTLGYGETGNGTVTVAVTLPGDANLDGQVNFADFVALQGSFGASGTTFAEGNFDFNDQTNFADFVTLQGNFGQSITGGRASFSREEYAAVMSITDASQVPEPAMLSLIGLGAAGLLRRRRTA